MASSPARKRLLLVYDVAYPFVKGGGQRRMYEVGRRLAQRGWEVDWLTFKSWEGGDELEQDGLRYLSLGPMPVLYNERGGRSRIEPLIFALRFLLRAPALGGYDAFWLGQWPLLHIAPAVALGRWRRKAVLIDWWEYWEKRLWVAYAGLVGRLGFAAQQAALRLCGRWAVLVTDCNLESGRLKAFLPADRVHVVPNGVPREEIGEVDPDRRPEFDVVYFGRLKSHKRVDVLLRALRSMADRRGQAPAAAIIGDGPERSGLEGLAKELAIDGQVRFFGKIPDSRRMYELVKKGAVCAVTTMAGGGGNLAILEANACGLPVVAFKCEDGIDTALIEEGRNGLLVASPTHEELGRSLDSLLDRPERLAEMRRSSLERSFDFDWDRITDAYEGILEKERRSKA